jgi:hypothetical protein
VASRGLNHSRRLCAGAFDLSQAGNGHGPVFSAD